MSEFDYLSVLISIVLGLGISHVLASAAQLVRYRTAVRFYAPTLFWLALLFVAHVQIWWAVFELRSVREWSFFAFVLVLSLPVIAYLASVLLSPDFDREEEIDLRASYYEQRRWLFALFALLPVMSLAQEYVIRGFIQLDADPVFRIAFALLAILGFVSARERLHQLLAPVLLGTFGAYIVLLFLDLQ